jgi:hypothetical protein
VSSIKISASPQQSCIPPFPIYRISVRQYHDMIQAGILGEDDSVELLEGWIVPKMPRSPAHDSAIELAEAVIRPWLPTGCRIRVQSAVTTDDSEPEPDLVVVEGDLRTFSARHPGSEDVRLIVEVAESSLATDRRDKSRIYAKADFENYWIINLIDRQVEVYSDPSSEENTPSYRTTQIYGPEGEIPLVLRGQLVATILAKDLLP